MNYAFATRYFLSTWYCGVVYGQTKSPVMLWWSLLSIPLYVWVVGSWT